MSTHLEDGFALWRQETEATAPGKANDVPYAALIPLIGMYTILYPKVPNPTSYSWRRAILINQDAMIGLRHSLERYADDLDDTFEMPIHPLPIDHSLQARRIDESIQDGLPAGRLTIPWNEELLARHLGLAVHDDAVRTQPLRLLVQGWAAMRNYYPQTTSYVQASV